MIQNVAKVALVLLERTENYLNMLSIYFCCCCYTISKFSSELEVGFLEYIKIFQVLLRLLCIYSPVNLSV